MTAIEPDIELSAHKIDDAKDYGLDLAEYKLATEIHRSYYELLVKVVTVFLAITAVSLGFVFQENVSPLLKTIFCWFNLLCSTLFCLSLTGFYFVAIGLAKRMTMLATNLTFDLRHHRGLPYVIMINLICGVCVVGFWSSALFFNFYVSSANTNNSITAPDSDNAPTNKNTDLREFPDRKK